MFLGCLISVQLDLPSFFVVTIAHGMLGVTGVASVVICSVCWYTNHEQYHIFTIIISVCAVCLLWLCQQLHACMHATQHS